MTPPQPPLDVDAVFAAAPPLARETLLTLRRRLFDAAEASGAGPLTETLKWGEPAYLTEKTRAGSTVRLGWKPARPQTCALLVNCRTALVPTILDRHPDVFRIEGTRALLFEAGAPLPGAALDDCLTLALTYHRWRKAGAPPLSSARITPT